MRTTKLLAAAGALGLITAPVLAQAADQPAARASSNVSGAENLAGGTALVAILALIAVVIGVVAASSNDHNDLPHSP